MVDLRVSGGVGSWIRLSLSASCWFSHDQFLIGSFQIVFDLSFFSFQIPSVRRGLSALPMGFVFGLWVLVLLSNLPCFSRRLYRDFSTEDMMTLISFFWKKDWGVGLLGDGLAWHFPSCGFLPGFRRICCSSFVTIKLMFLFSQS